MKKFKSVVSGTLAGLLVLSGSGVVSGAENKDVQVITRLGVERNYPMGSVDEKSQQAVQFSKETGAPIMLGGRTYVPLKVLGDALSIEVTYNKETRATEVEKNGIKIELFNGKYEARINGAWVPLDTKDGIPVKTATTKMIEGRTYVPLRFMSEALGLKVSTKANVIYIDEIQELTRFEEMVPGKAYTVGEVFYKPLNSYDPNWEQRFLSTYDQQGRTFDFDKSTLTYYPEELLEQGVALSEEVMLYGVKLDGDMVKVELSHPVHIKGIAYECNKNLAHEEGRGYSSNGTLPIEELPNGNYLVSVYELDHRYTDIKHMGFRVPTDNEVVMPSGNNTVVVGFEGYRVQK